MSAELLQEINDFLKRTGMKPSRFSMLVVGHRNLVFWLREGREARAEVANKARLIIGAYVPPPPEPEIKPVRIDGEHTAHERAMARGSAALLRAIKHAWGVSA